MQHARDGAGDRAHALGALALRAELVVVDHPGQAVDARGQRLLAVLVEEELGVGQARANHALVAADDRARVGRADVADDQKPVRQFPAGIEQRKVLLVGLHGENQAFLRDLEELRLEFTDQHIGPLDQAGDLIEQGLVVDRSRAIPNGGRGALELAHDVGAALGKTGRHRAVTGQGGGIAVGVGDDNGRHGRLETVAVRAIARAQSQHLDRHHGAAMQGDEAVRRSHKMHAAPARQIAVGLQLVTHDLRNRQAGNGVLERLLQASVQACARHQAVIEQGLGLAVGTSSERGHRCHRVRHIGAQRLQLLDQRRRGAAFGVQRDAHGHQLLLQCLVGGLEPDIRDVRGQPARRGKGGHRRVRCQQTLGSELRRQLGGKGFTQLLQRLGRQFFDKQFNQQVFHDGFTCSTHARGAIGKPRRWRLS